MTFGLLDRLHHVRVPTDVICAELDEIPRPEHMTLIADALVGASFRVLPRPRHLVPLQHSDPVAALLVPGDELAAP